MDYFPLLFGVDQTALVPEQYSQSLNFTMDLTAQS